MNRNANNCRHNAYSTSCLFVQLLNTVLISEPHTAFIPICQLITSHAYLLMANYTTYERERRRSLTSKHHRAISRKQKPVSEDLDSLVLEPLSMCRTFSKPHSSVKTHTYLLYSRCSLRFWEDAKFALLLVTCANKKRNSYRNTYLYTVYRYVCMYLYMLTRKLQDLWSASL